MLIKVKNYEHYNRAMGKQIHSKAHYKREMARGGYVPFKEGERIAKEANRNGHKPYVLSKEANGLVKAVRNLKPDKNGKVKLPGRMVDAMIKTGAIKPMSKHAPQGVKVKGGFR